MMSMHQKLSKRKEHIEQKDGGHPKKFADNGSFEPVYFSGEIGTVYDLDDGGIEMSAMGGVHFYF